MKPYHTVLTWYLIVTDTQQDLITKNELQYLLKGFSISDNWLK